MPFSWLSKAKSFGIIHHVARHNQTNLEERYNEQDYQDPAQVP